jgi:hypothetical protein
MKVTTMGLDMYACKTKEPLSAVGDFEVKEAEQIHSGASIAMPSTEDFLFGEHDGSKLTDDLGSSFFSGPKRNGSWKFTPVLYSP